MTPTQQQTDYIAALVAEGDLRWDSRRWDSDDQMIVALEVQHRTRELLLDRARRPADAKQASAVIDALKSKSPRALAEALGLDAGALRAAIPVPTAEEARGLWRQRPDRRWERIS